MSLEARELTFAFRPGHPILDGLDLEVAAGESISIMAPSGTGKTTLLSILGGLRHPGSGSVTLGPRPSQRSVSSGDVAWVFQAMHLIGRRTALDNVAIPVLARGAGRAASQERALSALELFGVAEHAARRVSSLSGGEAQRVALARASATEPLLVLADEPTANLDRTNAEHVIKVLVSGFPGAAVVVTTHDEAVARQTHRSFRLHDGKLIAMNHDAPLAKAGPDAQVV